MTIPLVFQLPRQTAFNVGVIASGAKAYFFKAGTTTPQDTYTTADLTTQHAHPVEANAAGLFPIIYLDDELQYRVQVKTSADVLIYDEDEINDPNNRAPFYPRTQAEIDAGVTPSDKTYPQGHVFRYMTAAQQADVIAGTGNEDVTTAIQNAIDVMSENGGGEVYFPVGIYSISDSLLWRNRVALRGESMEFTRIQQEDHTKPTLIVNTTSCPDGSGGGFSPNFATAMHLRELWIYYPSTPADKHTYTNAVAIKIDGRSFWSFEWDRISIYNVHTGLLVTGNGQFFGGRVGTFRVNTGYQAIYKDGTGFVTSVSFDWLRMSMCFHGVVMNNATYINMNVNHDGGGLNSTSSGYGPSNEMPINLDFDTCTDVRVTNLGTEQNNAIALRENNSEVEIAGYVNLSTTANLWVKSATRIDNIAEANQALFVIDDSVLKLSTFELIRRTSQGYASVSTTESNLLFLSGVSKVTFENGLLDVESYYFADSASVVVWATGAETFLSSESVEFRGMAFAEAIQPSTTTVRTLKNHSARTEAANPSAMTIALAANTNNLGTSGIQHVQVVRLSSTAGAVDLTGIVAPTEGIYVKYLVNVDDTDTITLKNDATSTAANRFLFGADIALGPNEGVSIWYDSSKSRWLAFGKHI